MLHLLQIGLFKMLTNLLLRVQPSRQLSLLGLSSQHPCFCSLSPTYDTVTSLLPPPPACTVYLHCSTWCIWPILAYEHPTFLPPTLHLFSASSPFLVVVGYPTPSEGWGHGGRPWTPRNWATPQGLDQRSYRDRESPKSERRKESVAGQCRMR